MSKYSNALASARSKPVVRQSDAEQMAAFCADTLPLLCGAVGPELVWDGAQAKNMTTRDLLQLAHDDRDAVEALQWI